MYSLTLFLRVRNPGVALLVVWAQGLMGSPSGSQAELQSSEGWAGAGGPASRMTHDYCSSWLQAAHSCPVVFSVRLLEFLHSMAAGFLVE